MIHDIENKDSCYSTCYGLYKKVCCNVERRKKQKQQQEQDIKTGTTVQLPAMDL